MKKCMLFALLTAPLLVIAVTTMAKIIPYEATAVDNSNSLSGIDENHNHVRDDIEHYINTTFTIAPQRAAALQLAKALGETLNVNTTHNNAAAKTASLKVSQAINCVFQQFTNASDAMAPNTIVTQLETITVNTSARKVAYQQYNAALNGTTSTLPEGNTCE